MKFNKKFTMGAIIALVCINVIVLGGYLIGGGFLGGGKTLNRSQVVALYELGNYGELLPMLPELSSDDTMTNIKLIVLLETGNFIGARELIESQENTTALMKQIYPFLVFADQEEWATAGEALNDVRVQGPKEKLVIERLAIYTLLKQGSLNKAKNDIKLVESRATLSPLGELITMRVSFQEKNWNKVINSFDNFRLLGGIQTDEVVEMYTTALYRRKKYNQIIELLSGRIQKQELTNEMKKLIAQSNFQVQAYDEAITFFDEILGEEDDNNYANRRLGRVYEAVGDLELSKRYYYDAYESLPNNYGLMLEMYPVVIKTDDVQRQELFEIQLVQSAKNAVQMKNFLNVLIDLGDIQKAVGYADEFMATIENSLDSLNKNQNGLRRAIQKAYVIQYYRQHTQGESTDNIEDKLLSTSPLDAGTAVLYANMLWDQGQITLAYKVLQSVDGSWGEEEYLLIRALHFTMVNNYEGLDALIPQIDDSMDRSRLEWKLVDSGYRDSFSDQGEDSSQGGYAHGASLAGFTNHFKQWTSKMKLIYNSI